MRFTSSTTTTGSGGKGIFFGGTGSGQLDGGIVNNGGVLNITKNDAGTWTLGGAIATSAGGSASTLTVSAGTLNLTAANSYSGGTTISAGTLNLTGAGTLGATTGALAANGGTLNLGTTTQTVGALTLGGGTIQNGTLNAASYASTGGTISANLGSAIGFTQTSGNTTLSGTNSINATTINGGYLTFANTAATGTGTITIIAGGSLVASGAQPTVQGWLGTGRVAAASAGSIAITGNSAENINFTGFNTLNLASTGTATYSGAITPGTGGYRFGGSSTNLTITSALGGANALVKSDAGTVNLTGTNNYSGITNVTAGLLVLQGTGSINGGAVTVRSGGSLFIGGTATLNATSGGAISIESGGGTLATYSLNAIGAAGSTITLNSGTAILAFGGSVSETTDRIISSTGSTGTFFNNGTGTLTFSNNFTMPNSALTRTFNGGGSTIIQGITGNTSAALTFNKAGVGTLTVNGNITPNGGGINAQGGVLNFSSTATTTGNALLTAGRTGGVIQFASGSSIKTADSNTSGILGGWATFDNTTFAKTNGTGLAIDGLADGSFAVNTWAAGNNTDVTLAGASPASGSTTHSLRFKEAGAKILTLAGNNTISSGGILVTSAVGANLTTITGGNLQGGVSSDLVIHQHNTAGALTIASGIINNTTTSVTKAGAGTVNFSTQKTYTGATNILAGTLSLTGGGGSVGVIRGTVNVAAGATLVGATGDSLGYNSDGTQVTTINLLGGTFNNSTGSNQGYTTNVNLTGGTMTSSGGGRFNFTSGFGITSLASGTTSLISGGIDIRDSSNLAITVASGFTTIGIDLNISGAIGNNTGGSGALTKAGAGTLVLSGANTYTGGTTVNGGTLRVADGGGNRLANASTVTVNNTGTFEHTGSNTTPTGVNAVNVVVNQGGIFRVSHTSGTNPHAHFGNITLNGGIVDLVGTVATYNGESFQLNGDITVGGSAASTIQSTAVAANQGIALAGTRIFTVNDATGNANADLTVTAELENSDANNGALTKNGAGTMVLSAINTFTGGTTVNAGELQASIGTPVAGAMTTFGTGAITVNSGATLRFKAGSTSNAYSYANAINLNGATLVYEDGNHTLSGAVALTGTNTINGIWGGKTLTMSNVISGAGGITASGSSTLRLTGANTYMGGTSVTGGTLILSGSNATSGISLSSGTTLALRSISLGATQNITGAGNLTKDISSFGDSTIGGTNNNYTGSTVVNISRFRLTSGGVINGTSGITVQGQWDANFENFGTITTAGTVAVNGFNGSGTAANSSIFRNGNAAGTTPGVLNAASLTLGADNRSSATVLAHGAEFFNHSNSTANFGAGAVTVNGQGNALAGSMVATGSTFTNAGTVTAGSITLNSSAVANIASNKGGAYTQSGGSTTLTGTLTLAANGGTGAVGTAGNDAALNLAGGTFSANAVAVNSGTLTLTGGTLTLGAGGLTTTGANAIQVNLGAGTVAASANWSSSVAATLTDAVSGTTVDTTGGTIALDGALSGSGQLVKAGTSTLTLTGESTYTGITSINAGALELGVGGSINSSSRIHLATGTTLIDVDGLTIGGTNAQTLSGAGTIQSDLTIGAQGIHAVGNSPGTQQVNGSLTYADDSIFSWDLATLTTTGRGTEFDGVGVTGNMTVESDAIFCVVLGMAGSENNAFWSEDRTWDNVFAVTGSITGAFTNFSVVNSLFAPVTIANQPNGHFTFTNAGSLSWSAVPEPSSVLAGLLLGAGLLRRRRR